MLKNEAKFKKNIVVGATLPYEARVDAEVLARLEKYRQELKRLCLAMTLVPIPCILIRDIVIMSVFWGIWIVLIAVLPMIPVIRCNRDLMEIKRRRGWCCKSSNTVTVDTAAIEPIKWISPVRFLLPLVISLLPFLWDREFWLVYLLDTAGVLFCWFGYRWLYRNKSERIDGDIELTKVLTQVRRRSWAKIWQLSAWLMAGVNLIFALLISHPVWLTVVMVFVSFAVTTAIFRVELRVRRIQEKLTATSGQGAYVDEDDKWIWGIIYYDPNDRHTMINSRIGTGSTFNMARPIGKIVVGLTMLLVLSIPFVLPASMAILDQPPELEISEETITAKSGRKHYILSKEEIASAELVDELPEDLSRVMGTGMEKLLTGTFSAEEWGRAELCLDPTEPPFLKLTTDEGEIYVFGTREKGEIENAFSKIE